MNDLEVTMHSALPDSKHGLQAHALAVQAAGVALQLARQVPAPLRFLADQLGRAACSVPLNLAEGHGRCGRDRVHHWRIAYGSAKEAGSALELLVAAGSIDEERIKQAIELFDRVRAMTWRLIRSRPWLALGRCGSALFRRQPVR